MNNNTDQKVEQIQKGFGNKMELVYNWVKNNEINFEEFEYLVEQVRKENQRQIKLDSFD